MALLRFALLLLVGPLCAQGTFYAAGISALPQTRPQPTGWFVSSVTAMGKVPNQTFLIVGEDYVYANRQIQAVGFAGTSFACYSLPFAQVYCFLGLGGASTPSTNSASIAITGGGYAPIPLNKKKTLDLIPGFALYQSSKGTARAVHLGFSFSF